jgi:hypothetical protein
MCHTLLHHDRKIMARCVDVDGVLDEYLFSGCWAGEYLPYAKAVEIAVAYADAN